MLHSPFHTYASCKNPFHINARHAPPQITQDSSSKKKLAAWSEDMIAGLYICSGWHLLKKNFCMRGSEIDLVLFDSTKQFGKIVEVKCRNQLSQSNLDLTTTEELLPPKKVRHLRYGCIALDRLCRDQGLLLNWSLDMVLVNPMLKGDSHRVTVWKDLPL
jgi:Holliday junction resolvase-like predicted endonuclease